MSDKIEMTVTINPLVSPLLFERLSACTSARHRATILRSLAEATLRQELTGYVRAPAQATPHAYSAPAPAPVRAPAAVDAEGFQLLRVDDSGHESAGFGDELGGQLAGYFE
ncbi:MAG: hypothetical protein ACN6QT_12050 [Burkholderia contaminans]|uniref:Uncharacterized protein n=1 Tax=Burkholderia aenigmatica TaxID=2015348 RepID=A0A228HNZ8_9BURK|nr:MULTISPECIES: hypothetical protein [Burkholderia cepacia complex]KVR79854.1 hypothetical protein WK24_30670 [Burkholderia vietnamiensis]KVS01740.1 hypothetical protein WK32_17140 [Burkholderia vietnamiensis]MBR8009218.1 hypothetical protein [Burkholderia vietnamiensis]MBR8152601.1 hypothetical protein [Burkholderia vietnamiensis]MBR8164615.1 hypothetical protein [Burkholderia vietnamiensis]